MIVGYESFVLFSDRSTDLRLCQRSVKHVGVSSLIGSYVQPQFLGSNKYLSIDNVSV